MNAPTSNGHAAPGAAPHRKPPLVPPHIAWPLFIVLLLLMSVGAALFTAYMAHSDGGVQLVEGAQPEAAP